MAQQQTERDKNENNNNMETVKRAIIIYQCVYKYFVDAGMDRYETASPMSVCACAWNKSLKMISMAPDVFYPVTQI